MTGSNRRADDGSDSRQSTPRSDPVAIYDTLHSEIKRVLVGNDETTRQLTIALLTRGHILLEGVPGIAKTTVATLFARATGLEYSRIQMTPDVLPADITGTTVYRETVGEFELQRGPIFANVVVADEINRATPKTQSALLEAMSERQVTIEDETCQLPSPFIVVATQNPVEMDGVFDLPEAQRDRFQFKLEMDVPDRAAERTLLDRFDSEPELGPDDVEPVVSPRELLATRRAVAAVHVAPAVKEYVLDLVRSSRDHPNVAHGASPRATLAFVDAAKANAALEGRAYVIPDDVKRFGEPILAHRLVLCTDADLGGVTPADVVADVVESVEPPGAEAIETDPAEPDSESPAAEPDGGRRRR
ncbi:MoxR family ATPase [Salinadaptatus halalkaliphilus]|uniref:MoxR family ATPase n=1 Tax=Salinadaptatus halalkaliphilus TaxID=2419781 RepID=A0A4S3TLK0_9EURY|nr:MoxR family ATPase [Salinadaptatus halalkaliphilus]THE65051.1 MoxR family ATPase [Salinadaptatus halalkaliphilus]